jgi:hypothetical protein
LVTISFVPDGTLLGTNPGGYVYSNLFAMMNARFGSPSVWEDQILLGAQSWAQQTNVNFEIVSDNGVPLGQGAYQQGDPHMGDIRIGGYAFTANDVGAAYMPPPSNNYSIAGDIQFNTNVQWNIGSTFDLFTVAVHEFGHALGLDEDYTDSTSVMWPYYNGTKTGLSSDDIAGIRTIYSGGAARSPDWVDASAPNNTWQTAFNLNPYVYAPTGTVLLPNMDITGTSDADWYVINAPAGTTGTPMILVQTELLSMMRPLVAVFSRGRLIAENWVGNPTGGSLLVVTLSNVTPGQALYLLVEGESSDAWGTGKYSLSLDFGTGPIPSVASPPTATPNANPLQGGGAYPDALDSFPAFAPPRADPAGRPTTVTDVAAVMQATAAVPHAARDLPVPPTVNISPSATPPVPAALQVAPALPGDYDTMRQVAVVTGPAGATPVTQSPAPAGPARPAGVSGGVPVQPEPAGSPARLNADNWSQASTDYFSRTDTGDDDVVGEGPSAIVLEATAAVAGFAAVAGESRFRSLRDLLQRSGRPPGL